MPEEHLLASLIYVCPSVHIQTMTQEMLNKFNDIWLENVSNCCVMTVVI